MTERVLNRPEPGYWAMRLVKGGPDVPACIVRRPTGFLLAYINGEIVSLNDVWEHKGRSLTKEQYEAMPIVENPSQVVDLEKLPLPF